VIDFGIARVTDPDPDTVTAHTAQGMLLGTLEYMSPEQASWSTADVDVRSDVYSLGVVLYELLTGSLPFASERLRNASPVEMQQLLRDTDPPAPSRRAAEEPVTDAVPATQLRRELDWVVMCAMGKDPARRYQSADALGQDLLRLLRHESVTAAPPGIGYRMATFGRRHRTATIAAAAVMFAVIAGGIAATVGLVQASHARDRALREARKSAAVNEFLTGMFASVEPDRARGNVVTVMGVLDSAATRLDRERPFANEPDVEASIRFSIGNSYRELGEYQAAIPLLTRAMELWQASLPPSDERLAMVTQGIGNAHWRRGQYDSALVYAQRLLALRTNHVPRVDPRYSQALMILANSRADLGTPTVAESLYRVALGIDSQVLAIAVGEVRDSARDNLGTNLNNLGTVLVDQRRDEEAINVFRQSLIFRQTFLPPDDPTIGSLLANLGQALVRAGRVEAGVDTLERAAALNERVYGPTHVTAASTWRKLGEAYLAAGRLDEAAAVLDRARQVYAERSGPTSHPVGLVMVRRGAVRVAAGDEAGGVAEMEEGWRLLRDGLGADHPSARAAAGEIADRHAARREPERAATWRARAGS
jgi:tetratricopeptide (TPR) repeat protein